MSEEEEEEGAEEEEEEIVLFSFQSIANGQRKEKTKQKKTPQNNRKEVKWKAAWSATFFAVSTADSQKGVAWDFGLSV